MRLRHDAVAKLVLGAVLQALESGGARRGRYEVRREVTIGSAASSGVEPDDEDLRPDAFLYDHDQRAVTPVEFTVPDDGRMAEAVAAKVEKYAAVLDRAVPAPPATAFRPLAVVAVGAWGTVHPSTVNTLVRLGVQPDRVTALLRNAVKIVANHAAIIARARLAAHTRGVPTAV